MMLYPDGGCVDDLLIYCEFEKDRYLLVVNAANTDKDFEWMLSHKEGFDVKIENRSDEWGQIAVQGPEAEKTLIDVLGLTEAGELGFYEYYNSVWKGSRLIISRTGYTGEDGFELYTDPAGTREIGICCSRPAYNPAAGLP